MKTLITILFTLMAIATTSAQNNVAFHLLSKEWSPEQESVMLRAIDGPTRALESEALTRFSRKDALQIFGSPARTNKAYKAIAATETVWDKNQALNALTDQEWATVWRLHLSTYFRDSTNEQRDYLIRLGRSLGNKELAKGFATEGLRLFGKEPFVTVGAFKSFGSCIENSRGKLSAGNCWCSIGSSFNMQCYNDCSSSQGGGCSTTDGQCGFLGLYNCDGGCRRDDYQPVDPPNN